MNNYCVLGTDQATTVSEASDEPVEENIPQKIFWLLRGMRIVGKVRNCWIFCNVTIMLQFPRNRVKSNFRNQGWGQRGLQEPSLAVDFKIGERGFRSPISIFGIWF